MAFNRGYELLMKGHQLTAHEVAELREYIAELPARLARPLTKAASAAEHEARQADSLAAVYLRANGFPLPVAPEPPAQSAAPAKQVITRRQLQVLDRAKVRALLDSPDPATRASARRLLDGGIA